MVCQNCQSGSRMHLHEEDGCSYNGGRCYPIVVVLQRV